MTTIPLTIREVKNKILADMDEAERRDSLVGSVAETGGYIILTEKRVIEVFEIGPTVHANVKNTAGGWDELEY